MKAPDKIYINPISLEGYFKDNHPDGCKEYVSKDALFEWASQRKTGAELTIPDSNELYGYMNAIKALLTKLESL